MADKFVRKIAFKQEVVYLLFHFVLFADVCTQLLQTELLFRE